MEEEGVLEMSSKERDRYKVLSRVVEETATQMQVVKLRNITD